MPRAQFVEYDAAPPAPRNECTKNTRKALLDQLQVWANDETTTKVYWLNGMAGTGKTTIAYSFSQILREKDSLGGTFFCSHIRADTRDARCIIPTISLQLAHYFPSLSNLIMGVVEGHPDCSSWGIDKQFQNFMVKPLTAVYGDPRGALVVPVIVLDALDECSNQSLVVELLSVILKHSKSLPVKFFIASRPEAKLKGTFDRSCSHFSFILHEVGNEIVKADIELYVKAYLCDKYNRPNWPAQAELERLVDKCDNLFIYAATVCKYVVQRGSRSSMPRRLSDVVNSKLEKIFGPNDPLHKLYERILHAAYADANDGERLDIDMVLTAVVYACDPLSIAAISTLMQIPIEHTETALSSLHSLIYIPSKPDMPISIFHASFYDFISNRGFSSKYYLDPCISHKSLAIQCLSLIKEEWSAKYDVPYLVKRECKEITESLAYACGSWAFHFTYGNNPNGSAELKDFFQNHLLQWMDCLSILGKLETAIHSLHKLGIWANVSGLNAIDELCL